MSRVSKETMSMVEKTIKDLKITQPLKKSDQGIIAQELGISKESVRHSLKNLGIKTHKVTYIEKFPKSEHVLGYICGLMASDGNLVKDRKSFQFSLQERDRELVYWVVNQVTRNQEDWEPMIVTPNKEVVSKINGHQIENRQPMYKFYLTLPKLYDYCLDLGLTPNKSLSLSVDLSNKSNEFKIAFFLGTVDGDGSINASENLSDCAVRLYSASPVFIKQMQDIFGGSIQHEERSSSHMYSLLFKSYNAQLIASEFKKVKVPGLDRKRKSLGKIINSRAKIRLPLMSSELVGDYWGSSKPSKNYAQLWEESDKVVDYAGFWARINQLGWSTEEALTTPKYKHRKVDKRTLKKIADANQ